MSKILTAAAAVVAATATLVTVAAAEPVAAKQRIAIQMKGQNHSFVLTPLTPGTIKRDSGTASFYGYTARHITRDGQAIEINNPKIALTGKHGTLVIQAQLEWIDIANGWAVANLTWKVIAGGTGDYADTSGSGRAAGVTPPHTKLLARFDGFLRQT